MHLLSLAVQKGVNLQTNTPVLSISLEQDADGYWSVNTERGTTRAKNIIFATNGYTRHLLPSYTGKIIPTRGICSHIKADAGMPKLAPSVRTMGIKYSPGCQDYLISRADGSIVVGGAWKVVRPGPKEDWSDVIDDSKLVPAAETYYDGFMERTFASWRTVPSQVDHLWTGIMGVGLCHVVQEQWVLTDCSIRRMGCRMLAKSTSRSQVYSSVLGLTATACHRCCCALKGLSRWLLKGAALARQVYHHRSRLVGHRWGTLPRIYMNFSICLLALNNC